MQNYDRTVIWVNYNVTDAFIVGTRYAGASTNLWKVWDLKYYNTTHIFMLVKKGGNYNILANYDTVGDSWGTSYMLPSQVGSFIQGDTRNL